ncbi:DUF4351 domain-containing protein [Leptodesmis sichuanensis]|uniref:DUF4351 domain-containing protein n=1 Tax=Leptodesmis sichuanensis TaxID=2906798 RepID=UPI001F1D009E|nr:DUF4351 domain-containing protein [Leptodesmis sichuanensis]UIE38885.1 DUF4351 domain-containing protein [Leptodesmis sichuanensis A121]
MAARTDQDSPWKEILRQYFPEAIAFFFPDLHRCIDWQKPPEFLDKEFQQIAPDTETGKRYADLLVKVWRKRGSEFFLLLHVEVQAKPEANFSERMLVYALRIFDRFRQPAVSLAILCDGKADWRPNQYEFSFLDTRLLFQFGTVKLLEYQERWQELEASPNPFATVVMAHLKAQETKRNSNQRKEWKLNLIRGLYEAGSSRRDVLNLFKFIDWVMILPEGVKQAFWLELKAFEEEQKVTYITSVEEIGFERGLQQGRQEERRSLISLQLEQKVGQLPSSLHDQIAQLNLTQLEALAIALLNLSTLAELEAWLEAHKE